MTLTGAPGDLGAVRLRLARWARRGQFLLFGFLSGVWGVHIPSVKANYGLDARALSMALLALAIGAVLCLTIAGRVVARFGARAAALGAGLLMCAGLAIVLLPSVYAALIAVVVAIGCAFALFDVAINAEGSVLEAVSGKKVMNGFHGMFSLGGMAGAALGALLIAAEVAAPLQLAAAAVAAAALTLVASTFMLPVHGGDSAPAAGYRVPRGALAVLAELGPGGRGAWRLVAGLGREAHPGVAAARTFHRPRLRLRPAPGRSQAA